MIGTIVFEENGFPVELGSAREIERAVANGRLRADTLVRTGMDDGDPRVAAAHEIAWLRPFLGLAEPVTPAPPAPVPAPAPAPEVPVSRTAATQPAPALPPTPVAPPAGLVRPTGSTIWQPPVVASVPKRGSVPLTPVTSAGVGGGQEANARRAAAPAKPRPPYVEPGSIFGRAFMPLLRYATFEGRSSPREYWAFMVLLIGGMVLASIEAGSTGLVLAILAVTLPSIAVAVRRCHDHDRSGWFVLVALVPYVGWLILLVLMMIPGTAGPNRYGINPMHGR